jgi:SAM-dependent methyltransferase
VRSIERGEGRRLFGADPAAYDAARPGHAERVYDVLVERCGLRPGAPVLEVGPGTGQATRPLLELGARPLVAIEPNRALADHLGEWAGERVEVRVVALEDARLEPEAFELAVAASSFHWVTPEKGLATIFRALEPGGWWAMWWTLFGDHDRPDAFALATEPLLTDLRRSPSSGRPRRAPHALDSEARIAELHAAGFTTVEHEVVGWSSTWDANGIRALYATFSPIARLPETEREAVLDGVARVAELEFGGRVERPLFTSLWTARRPG